MNEHSIIDVPEMREMIFRHLDEKDREKAIFVSPSMHRIICGLPRKRLTLTTKIMEDDVFYSMMHSYRRFKEIKINISNIDEDEIASRIVAILEKFKTHMKSLIVCNFHHCSKVHFTAFLEAATDVEKLYLYFRKSRYDDWDFVLQKSFNKLKKLTVPSFNEITGIAANIPDNCLESLTVIVRWDAQQVSQKGYTGFPVNEVQKFVNRQSRLKKMQLPNCSNLDLGHLALNKLYLPHGDLGNDDDLAAIIKNQHALMKLRCGHIGSKSVRELKKMENLKVLLFEGFVHYNNVELKSIQRLYIDSYGHTLHRLTLPYLEKLTLDMQSLTYDQFAAFGASTQNLKHIEIKTREVTFFPLIIDQCPALKTVLFCIVACHDLFRFDNPSCQNLSLEQMRIESDHCPTFLGSFYDLFKACPNLRSLQMLNILVYEEQIRGILWNLDHLTHFWLGDAASKFPHQYFNSNIYSDSGLREIAKQFNESKTLDYLALWNIGDKGSNRLLDDSGRVLVEKFYKTDYRTCMTLARNSEIRERFDKFHSTKLPDCFNKCYYNIK